MQLVASGVERERKKKKGGKPTPREGGEEEEKSTGGRRKEKKKYSIEAKTRRNVSRNAGKPRISSGVKVARLDSRRKDVCGRG